MVGSWDEDLIMDFDGFDINPHRLSDQQKKAKLIEILDSKWDYFLKNACVLLNISKQLLDNFKSTDSDFKERLIWVDTSCLCEDSVAIVEKISKKPEISAPINVWIRNEIREFIWKGIQDWKSRSEIKEKLKKKYPLDLDFVFVNSIFDLNKEYFFSRAKEKLLKKLQKDVSFEEIKEFLSDEFDGDYKWEDEFYTQCLYIFDDENLLLNKALRNVIKQKKISWFFWSDIFNEIKEFVLEYFEWTEILANNFIEKNKWFIDKLIFISDEDMLEELYCRLDPKMILKKNCIIYLLKKGLTLYQACRKMWESEGFLDRLFININWFKDLALRISNKNEENPVEFSTVDLPEFYINWNVIAVKKSQSTKPILSEQEKTVLKIEKTKQEIKSAIEDWIKSKKRYSNILLRIKQILAKSWQNIQQDFIQQLLENNKEKIFAITFEAIKLKKNRSYKLVQEVLKREFDWKESWIEELYEKYPELKEDVIPEKTDQQKHVEEIKKQVLELRENFIYFSQIQICTNLWINLPILSWYKRHDKEFAKKLEELEAIRLKKLKIEWANKEIRKVINESVKLKKWFRYMSILVNNIIKKVWFDFDISFVENLYMENKQEIFSNVFDIIWDRSFRLFERILEFLKIEFEWKDSWVEEFLSQHPLLKNLNWDIQQDIKIDLEQAPIENFEKSERKKKWDSEATIQKKSQILELKRQWLWLKEIAATIWMGLSTIWYYLRSDNSFAQDYHSLKDPKIVYENNDKLCEQEYKNKILELLESGMLERELFEILNISRKDIKKLAEKDDEFSIKYSEYLSRKKDRKIEEFDGEDCIELYKNKILELLDKWMFLKDVLERLSISYFDVKKFVELDSEFWIKYKKLLNKNLSDSRLKKAFVTRNERKKISQDENSWWIVLRTKSLLPLWIDKDKLKFLKKEIIRLFKLWYKEWETLDYLEIKTIDFQRMRAQDEKFLQEIIEAKKIWFNKTPSKNLFDISTKFDETEELPSVDNSPKQNLQPTVFKESDEQNLFAYLASKKDRHHWEPQWIKDLKEMIILFFEDWYKEGEILDHIWVSTDNFQKLKVQDSEFLWKIIMAKKAWFTKTPLEKLEKKIIAPVPAPTDLQRDDTNSAIDPISESFSIVQVEVDTDSNSSSHIVLEKYSKDIEMKSETDYLEKYKSWLNALLKDYFVCWKENIEILEFKKKILYLLEQGYSEFDTMKILWFDNDDCLKSLKMKDNDFWTSSISAKKRWAKSPKVIDDANIKNLLMEFVNKHFNIIRPSKESLENIELKRQILELAREWKTKNQIETLLSISSNKIKYLLKIDEIFAKEFRRILWLRVSYRSNIKHIDLGDDVCIKSYKQKILELISLWNDMKSVRETLLLSYSDLKKIEWDDQEFSKICRWAIRTWCLPNIEKLELKRKILELAREWKTRSQIREQLWVDISKFDNLLYKDKDFFKKFCNLVSPNNHIILEYQKKLILSKLSLGKNLNDVLLFLDLTKESFQKLLDSDDDFSREVVKYLWKDWKVSNKFLKASSRKLIKRPFNRKCMNFVDLKKDDRLSVNRENSLPFDELLISLNVENNLDEDFELIENIKKLLEEWNSMNKIYTILWIGRDLKNRKRHVYNEIITFLKIRNKQSDFELIESIKKLLEEWNSMSKIYTILWIGRDLKNRRPFVYKEIKKYTKQKWVKLLDLIKIRIKDWKAKILLAFENNDSLPLQEQKTRDQVIVDSWFSFNDFKNWRDTDVGFKKSTDKYMFRKKIDLDSIPYLKKLILKSFNSNFKLTNPQTRDALLEELGITIGIFLNWRAADAEFKSATDKFMFDKIRQKSLNEIKQLVIQKLEENVSLLPADQKTKKQIFKDLWISLSDYKNWRRLDSEFKQVTDKFKLKERRT